METFFGEIITFYSYKGGAGRSMALANVACLLAQKPKVGGDVLMIDWDLEAPGLHQFFHGRFNNTRDEQGDLPPEQLGLIDLFYEIRNQLEKSESQDNILEDIFSKIDIQKYIVKLNRPSLFLMPAGKFEDGLYSSRVNQFDWADFFDKFPLIITQFAEYLRKKYKYVLIDSRTGYTDISGICTSIMPEKLVTVFTPNRQSLSGVVEMIRRAIDYRKQSDDLRPLMIFPLPSRIENAENKLQKDWRFGNSNLGVEGYQIQIESVLTKAYSLQECDLTTYFDEYQLQYVTRYSYGEEISVLSERSEDRLSLARSFENFTEKIIGHENPWEGIKVSVNRSKLEREKREAETYETSQKRSAARRKLILQSLIAIFSVAVIVLLFFVLSNLATSSPIPPQSALQFLYDLVNWQYFGILAIIWAVVDLVWIDRWRMLIIRIGRLVSKPWIFEKDKEPHDLPLYPRVFLEQLAFSNKHEDTRTDRTYINWMDAQRSRVFDAHNPLRSLGYVMSLLFFVFFLLADAIVIANTLILMGVISNTLPPIFQRLELAILGGAVLSAVVGVWLLVEMSGKGELINTDLEESQKRLFKWFATIVILLSLIVMIALAVQRLVSLGYMQSSATTDLVLTFILYGILSINTSLSAALTFSSAMSGLIVVMYLLIMLVVGLLPVFVFLLDILWRAAYIVLDIFNWALFTPVIAIPYGVTRIFGLVQ